MNSLLLWIGGLLVVALGALSGVPYLVDWNTYRGHFEEQASRLLDRQVRVDGSVSVKFLPVPYVRFEKVRIAEAVGEIGTPDFFRAESFTLWLAVAPLLKGVIEASEVEVKRPVVNLRLRSDGGGNWQTLKVIPTELPFVPRDVAFQSVKIGDGVVVIHQPSGEEVARVEVLAGELSGAALDGPYKFRGDIRWNREPREVRVSTARPDADGSIRCKVVVRVPASGNSYTFNGKVADLALRPRLEGTFAAVLHGDGGAPAAAGSVAAPVARRTSSESGAFELRANMSADTSEGRLDDIALFFEQDGKPQLVAGSARASWLENLIVRTSLSSRWLDFDRIAGGGGDVSPWETLRRLATRLTGSFPASGEVLASVSIDQVNLGSDVISGFALTLHQANGDVQLKELKATLPGGTRAVLKGRLNRGEQIESLDGELQLRGASLARFMAWAAKQQSLPVTRSDASFSLQARVSLSSDAVELREAAAEIAGHALSGDLGYRWKDRKLISLALDGKRIDLPPMISDYLGRTLSELVLQPRMAIAGITEGDLRLRVRVGQIDGGERTLRNVDIAIVVQDGVLSVQQMRFSTGNGLVVELQGELKDSGGGPKGTLNGLVEAADRAALSELLELLNYQDGGGGLTALAPLRLGYNLSVGARGDGAAGLTLEGMVADNQLAATVALQRGLAAWRAAPLEATLVLDGRNLAPVIRVLLPSRALAPTASREQSPGWLLLKVLGTPAEDLVSSARLEMDGLGLAFRGRAAWPNDKPLRLDGNLQIQRAEVGRALDLVGVKRRPHIADVGITGEVSVQLRDGTIELEPRELAIGGTSVAGRVTIALREKENRLDARLTVKDVSIPKLLALLVDGRAPDAPAARSPGEADSPWPDEPFDFSNYDEISGRLVLEASSMGLAESVNLRNAIVEADLSPVGITVTKIEGRGLGGAVSGTLKLEKAPVGASLEGSIRLTDARLAELVPVVGGQPSASGEAHMLLQFSGQARSPLALVAGLSGQGEVELKGVRLPRLSPAAIEAVATAALGGKVEAGGLALERALRAAIATRPLDVGTRKLPLQIVDGAVRVGAFSVEAPEGRASNQTTIDLVSLRFDSEWKLEPPAKTSPRSSAAGRAALPGISVIYVGTLAAVHTLDPRLSFEALERELSVRKMERDVDQLERVRLEDEARARAEAERLRAVRPRATEPSKPAPRVIEAPLPVPEAATTGPIAPAPTNRLQSEAQGAPVPAPEGGGPQAGDVSPAPQRRKVERISPSGG